MKSYFSKNEYAAEGKSSWLPQPGFYLAIITAVIIALYVLALRPYLMLNMATVTIELAASVIIVLAFVLTMLIIAVTLLITLIVAAWTREGVRIMPWLLKLRSQFIIAGSLVLILAFFTLCTQWMAYTPPILGADGKPDPGSIAKLEKITLEGSEQWITIRGKNPRNPVLLFLAGGPGGSQLAATRDQLKALEDHFVVVNWDQPGSAKSYHSVPFKSLTRERYISDGHQLTLYLTQRFNQDKIYVLGESWGSALGIWMVQRNPELYHAFIGTGQMIAFAETEKYCYEQALKIASERGDRQKIEDLKRQGPPPYYGNDVVWKESAYLMYLSDYMMRNPAITNSAYNTLGDMAAPEYGLYDKINYVRGIIYTFNHVYQQLYDFDLRKQATKINVPVYFLEGRHDINAPPVLVEDYYKILDAPRKEFIWFERSGHSAWINERDKFVDIIVNLVLKETKPK